MATFFEMVDEITEGLRTRHPGSSLQITWTADGWNAVINYMSGNLDGAAGTTPVEALHNVQQRYESREQRRKEREA